LSLKKLLVALSGSGRWHSLTGKFSHRA